MNTPESAGAPTVEPVEPLLGIRDICTTLRISRGTLHTLVQRNELVPTYVRSLPRFERQEVRDYIRRHRRHGEPDRLPEGEQSFLDGLRDQLDAREVEQ